jgi:TPR repeat protein
VGRTGSKLRRSSLFDRVTSVLSPAMALRRAMRLRERGRAARAFPLFAHAARSGIAEAEYRVGRCYLEGSGVPISHTEGLRWLRSAATRGHIEAQWFLAVLCIQGVNASGTLEETSQGAVSLFSDNEAATPDFAEGEMWARRSAGQGSAAGQALLGYILTSGPESMRNLEEAHQCYERSAAAGCAQGSLGYALSLARTATDEKDQIKVAEHIRRSAEAGLAPADRTRDRAKA